MRPRASQVAKTRLVETEEDVETYRPVLDAIKSAIRDRQAELAMLEGELSADATEARRRLDGLVHCQLRLYDGEPAIVGALARHPSPCQGEVEGTGGGSVFYLPQAKLFIYSNLRTKGEVGGVKTGLIILYVKQFRS